MGIQISGLLSNQAFDWKSVVDQLVAIDGVPITNLQTQKATNDTKISALNDVYTSLGALQDSLQSIRSNNTFTDRSVVSSDSTSTWRSTSSAGAPLGAYTFNVTRLATASTINGTADIGAGINLNTAFSSLNTASAVTAGTFTVNGKQITVSTGDSVNTVFANIAAATGNTVTGGYNADPTDTIFLTSSTGSLLLGAGNDTSNFLQVMKLANSGGATSTSSSALGVVKSSATLVNSMLRTMPTAVDASGNGTFSINNVAIAYNVNNDSLNAVLARINQSAAGVTASYDATKDKVIMTNKSTGDIGISVSEAAGGLLASLGVTNAGLARGVNVQYTVNNGATLTGTSNTLDQSSHGINGLSVIVNSLGTQTLTVQSDTTTMTSAVQDFLDKFNAVQDTIEAKTKITTSGTSTTTSVLSGNHEIQEWSRKLQAMAFNQVAGVTGSITHLDDLGIDFDGTTGHLTIKNSGKFNAALANKPDDVQAYFSANGGGQVPQMYGLLTNLMTSDLSQQDSIRNQSSGLDDQITTLQSRLADERTRLTNSFIQMLDAQSSAQSQSQALTNQFFNNNNNGCWVARAVYGESNPRWRLFRHWLFAYSPAWFRALYLRHGERVAAWISDKPRLKTAIRFWMDARIKRLFPL